MRILATLLVLLSFPAFAADDPALQKERAQVASTLFRDLCFMQMGTPDERLKMLNAEYPHHEGVQKDTFLKMMRAEKGDVWAVVYPTGAYAIVVEPGGSCHVIANKSDDVTIHEQMKKLTNEVAQAMTDVAIKKYEIQSEGPMSSSGFDIKSKEEKPQTLAIVIASTMKDAPEDKPAALMTLKLRK